MVSIQPSWHIARLSLLGRPSRTILVGISVALASTIVVTVNCALSSAKANIHHRMGAWIGEADARVVHEHGADFDESVLEVVRTLPDIVAISGRLNGALSLRRADGACGSNGQPLRATLQCRGTDLSEDEAFDQVKYKSGHAPILESEIGIDTQAAEQLQAVIGTVLSVVHFGDPIELRVTGILDRKKLGALQRPTGHLSRRVLAEIAARDSDIAIVSIVLREGVDAEAWVKANASRLEAPLKLESIELAASGLDRPERASEVALAVATMLAFLCCSFIVATAMTTALSEQQRALAVARCIGASKPQLFFGQLLAGALLCFCAGAVGVPTGIAITAIAVNAYSDLLPAGLSISSVGIALAMIGATFAGIAGALWPAWRATRVSVLRALAPQMSAASAGEIRGAALCGIGCIAVQVGLTLIPDQRVRFWFYVLLGLPLMHVGWFLLAVPTLRIVGGACAPSIERWGGIPRGLLSGSLRAQPWRFGLIAGSMMIGLSVLVSTWTNGGAILQDVSERVRFGDAFAFKATGFSGDELKRLREIPGVNSTAAVGYLPLKVIGQQVLGLEGLSTPNVVCIGFDSAPFMRMNRLDWIEGDPSHAASRLKEGNAVLVAKEFRIARGIGPGAWIELGSDSDHHSFEVVGVVGSAGLDVATQFFGIRSLYMDNALSCVFMDFDAVAKYFGTREAFLLQMSMPEGATDSDEEVVAAAIESAAPGSVFASGRGIRKEILEIGSILLSISTFIAVGVLLLAALASGGVMAAGVASRSFELGVLEAVGASKRVVSRLILAEALLIGVTAAIIGTLLGLQLAWMGTRCYREIAGLELTLVVPIGVVASGTVAVCLASLLAAGPALRILHRRSAFELLGGVKG